jgi:hypothetical protein
MAQGEEKKKHEKVSRCAVLWSLVFLISGSAWAEDRTKNQEKQAQQEASTAWQTYKENGYFGATTNDRALQILWTSSIQPLQDQPPPNTSILLDWTAHLLLQWKGDGTAARGNQVDPVVNMLSHNPTVVQEALLKRKPGGSRCQYAQPQPNGCARSPLET